MTGCQWEEICVRKDLGVSKLSAILFKYQISETEMIQLFNTHRLYGFVLCDIEASSKSEKFMKVNWPPLIFKDEVNFNDLPLWMQENAIEKNFPRTTIVQGMFRKNLLLHTEI